MKHIFTKPYNFEGKEYTELELELDSLTGRDVSSVKRQWAGEGNFSAMPSTDSDFCIMIAAKAAKKPVEFFYSLPAKEYAKLAQAVSNFLLG